ncbi:hypothetical protein DFH07DRAFT_772062 [Mycena maculata]|uniref:Uncharacterized protein n=1 Tax=Mycena maculata TaxID=230809 RepID=A0AAD7JAH9_9AGAR|nr:hypothetical protein DFH07DRAFT_772062 [Mycena maculata]
MILADKEYLELDQSDSDTEPFPLTATSPKAVVDVVNVATSVGPEQAVSAGLLTLTGANPISTSTITATTIPPSSLGGPSPFSVVPSTYIRFYCSDGFRPIKPPGHTPSAHASGSASTSHGSFSAEDHGRHYVSSTAALEPFNTSGNCREGTPPKCLFTAVMSSGFPSPERPVNNPWRKRRKIGD